MLACVVEFIERFQGLIGTIVGLIIGSWMIMRSHYKAQSRRESIRMMMSRIDDFVLKCEKYWLMRFNHHKDDDPTTLAIKIQAEFVYFDVAFQSLMGKEDCKWKQLLQDFFDATTGDVFARKTKITKELYCEKIAKIHIKAIALKGFLLKHL